MCPPSPSPPYPHPHKHRQVACPAGRLPHTSCQTHLPSLPPHTLLHTPCRQAACTASRLPRGHPPAALRAGPAAARRHADAGGPAHSQGALRTGGRAGQYRRVGRGRGEVRTGGRAGQYRRAGRGRGEVRTGGRAGQYRWVGFGVKKGVRGAVHAGGRMGGPRWMGLMG